MQGGAGRNGIQIVVKQVGVDVQRHRRRGMAERLLHRLDVTRLSEDINALKSRITDRVREVAPRLYGNARVRPGNRGEDHGRDRARDPLLR